MRKLLIVAFAVGLTSIVQAATVNWNSGMIYVAKDATGAAGNLMANAGTRLVTAYLYTFADEAAYNAAKALSVDNLYTEYVGKKSTAVSPVNTGATGMANIAQTGLPDGSDVAPQTVYGVVIYVDTKTAASFDNVDAFVKASFNTTTWQDTTGMDFANLAGGKSAWTAVGAVPEPTSGLMLLIGVGLMALKRKRA